MTIFILDCAGFVLLINNIFQKNIQNKILMINLIQDFR